jgi:DNA-binding beta-propeller fold protein YncE
MALDKFKDVHVADYGNSRIQKFTFTGIFAAKFGSVGLGNGQFLYPSGIAIDKDGYMYVADTNNQRIQKFLIK